MINLLYLSFRIPFWNYFHYSKEVQTFLRCINKKAKTITYPPWNRCKQLEVFGFLDIEESKPTKQQEKSSLSEKKKISSKKFACDMCDLKTWYLHENL